MPLPLYRSDTVKHGTIVTTRESAHATVAALGNNSKIFFMDGNAELMLRPYKSILQRIEMMEQQLNSIFKHLRRIPSLTVSQANVDEFLQQRQYTLHLDTIAKDLDMHFKRMNIFEVNHESLLHDREILLEEYNFLKVTFDKKPYTLPSTLSPLDTDKSMNQADISNASTPSQDKTKAKIAALEIPLSKISATSVPFEKISTLSLFSSSAIDSLQNTHLSVLAGTVASDVHARFVRLVLVLARRNVFVSSEKMEVSSYAGILDEEISIDRHVFFIYYHGSIGSFLHQSLVRICEAFETHLFPIAISMEELERRLEAVRTALTEKQNAIAAYYDYIKYEFEDLLTTPGNNKNCKLAEWQLFILEEKAIHMTLNKFQASDATMRCNCWILGDEEKEIRNVLTSKVRNAFLLVDAVNNRNIPPPTYIRSNDFVGPFQLLVDTYGVPRYKEINPGLFTIIPYPFLFGLMFGDAGHGLVLFIIGLYLLFQRKGSISPLFRDAWKARYMLTLMGFFSLYAGLLYNEFFGLGMNLFRSRWIPGEGGLVPAASGFPYPFGIDPEWRSATNELAFTNSFKMKFAMVVAFVQMFFGLCLRGVNAIYFQSYLDFLFTFLPQIVFFTGFVGYLVFLIVFKWVTPLVLFAKPNILNSFVDMFLFRPILPVDQLFPFQTTLQSSIVFLLLASIPIMLFVKPLADVLYMKRKIAKESTASSPRAMPSNDANQSLQDSHSSSDDTVAVPMPPSSASISRSESKRILERQVTITEITGSISSKSKAAATAVVGEEDSIGFIFTHQMIETTEFLLGTLSNTASYLRLWALSLAHAELSKILLEQVFFNFLNASNNPVLLPILLYIGTIAFVVATTAIILMLDLIEGALHALRLQWVEFQNKFYAGDGYAFLPFSFREVFLAATQTEDLNEA
ncbi:putative vacuolar proton translocating ATPase subunit [Cardiosporidium cionae]|uniref:V-type proton ATPase subunit a n=1 Tax=Cardiosporidium cionae TaxID=476202 RepID=A0ABQ7J944_9APIC|nr:putative vacuolar proton translocating ATPase subunit [Cardiosporidium cionae]|eukprot:KAF8820520.1 putative vacuolar proton translocating ATPase subunit [Cardiosporidium cionae]